MWRKLGIEDKDIINDYTKGKFKIFDFNFTNLFLWAKGESIEYKIENDILSLKGVFEGKDYYYMPVPKSETEESLKFMIEEINKILDSGSSIGYFDDYWKNKLETYYEFIEDRNYFDYIYLTESLAFLKGRKYSKKKNRVNNFIRNYDYTYEEINKNNISEVFNFQDAWCLSNECELEESLTAENLGISRVLSNFLVLDVVGGVLKVDNKVVGFSIGEVLNENTAVIHIEKALAEYTGSYQILNSLFLQHNFLDYEFVNREDDFGEEGLREAKLSYHPIELLKKYYIKSKKINRGL